MYYYLILFSSILWIVTANLLHVLLFNSSPTDSLLMNNKIFSKCSRFSCNGTEICYWPIICWIFTRLSLAAVTKESGYNSSARDKWEFILLWRISISFIYFFFIAYSLIMHQNMAKVLFIDPIKLCLYFPIPSFHSFILLPNLLLFFRPTQPYSLNLWSFNEPAY